MLQSSTKFSWTLIFFSLYFLPLALSLTLKVKGLKVWVLLDPVGAE